MRRAASGRVHGALRRVLRLFAALVLTTMMLLGVQVTQAHAEADSVDKWSFTVEVDSAGLVHVTETLTYRFGQSSGRHGIIRSLVVREPWDDEQDAVYTVQDVEVNSTDASGEFTTSTSGTGRNRLLGIRIGSRDRTITTPTATYTISYTVAGAMRTFQGYDEFYWDLLSGEAPATGLVDARVKVPGGAKDVACSSAPPGQQTACTSAEVSGQEARFTEQNRPTGEVLTVGVKILSGQVANPEPDLQPKASGATSEVSEQTGLAVLAAPVATTGVAGLVGWSVLRRKGRDLRFQGVPPGVVPPPNTHAPVKLSEDIEIPVAFSPPRIPVAEAGLLVDGQVDVRETTATLVDLTVRGAIQMRQGPNSSMQLRLVDTSRAQAPHESVLLRSIFGRNPSKAWVTLSDQGSMASAHQALVASVTNQVSTRGWFTDVPRTAAKSGIGGLIGIAFFAFPALGGGPLLWWLLALLGGPAVVAWIISRKLRRGQRTAVGRAVTDQIEGFELYLTTAETNQLRFEEGEDIFSRYLPWAIIFGVAERWAQVCQPLIAAGQIPAPTWTGSTLGDWYVLSSMLSSLERVSMPAPSASGSGLSGTGFGGGSSFGGGGISSGGGGGGGSASSW